MGIKFDIDKRVSKKRKKGESRTIYVWIQGRDIPGGRMHPSTGIKIEPRHWDDTNKTVKRSHPDYFEMRKKLNKLENDIMDRIQSLRDEGVNSDAEFKRRLMEVFGGSKSITPAPWISQAQLRPTSSDSTFFRALHEFEEELRDSPGRIHVYNALKNHLLAFQDESRIELRFGGMTMALFKNFKRWCHRRRISDNTLSGYVMMFKQFLVRSVEKGYSVHKDHLKFIVSGRKTDKFALKEEELRQIVNFDLTPSKQLEAQLIRAKIIEAGSDNGIKSRYKALNSHNEAILHAWINNAIALGMTRHGAIAATTLSWVRDIFAFQCFTGQRYSDVRNLTRANISGKYWRFSSQKTSDNDHIPLSNDAISILEKYADIPGIDSLPQVSYYMTNEWLKKLCRLVGIVELTERVRFFGKERVSIVKPKCEFITTHVARTTFATRCLRLGMEAKHVMELMKITKWKTFETYIRLVAIDKQNAVDQILNNAPLLEYTNSELRVM